MTLPSNVSAIRAGLTSFSELALNPEVTSINVHSNSIKDFTGLNAPDLKELDVSSNQISNLSGLRNFRNLISLNVACNQLSDDIDGLGELTNLTHLNLSYNSITSLHGFLELNGKACKLETLELHGNQISIISDVTRNLSGISSLRHLILSRNEKCGNPVCQTQNYRAQIFSTIPHLVSLDNKDRNGQEVASLAENVLKMMGLDLSLSDIDYTSEIQSSSLPLSSPEKVPKPSLKTPHIDAVLSNNRVKSRTSNRSVAFANHSDTLVESIISSVECIADSSPAFTSDSPEKTEIQNDQESRLKFLESQLANLVAARQEAEKGAQATRNQQQKSESSAPSSSGRSVTGTKTRIPARNPITKGKTVNRATPKLVQRHGAQEKDTYINLVKELEAERERRWKSEQAAKKLAEIVRNLNAEKSEGKSLHDMAAHTADKLKEALLREREQTDKMKSDILMYKEKVADMSDEILNCRKTIEDQENLLEKAEKDAAGTAEDQSKNLAKQAKRLHDAEMRASGALREADIQKAQNSQLEKRLSELQEVFCKQQQGYEREKESMFTLDSLEFKNALSKELHKQDRRHHEKLKTLQLTIATLRNQYAELEDEFRQALHIEAERFAQVNAQNASDSTDLQKLRNLYRKSKEKEEKCQSIITQLTSVAKEQKLKIIELSNTRKEVTKQFDDQISKLEIVAENGRRSGVQLELIKQEKSRLVSQLAALQSVVDGLRDERKLWGHELAQQGSSLAQDRGRLESRIETLQQEIASLRKQNERDLDALKIKSKIVDDQTETIQKMKQGLVEKDREIVKIQEQSLERHGKLEQDVEDLTQDNAASNEQISVLLERKKELKENLADSEKDLDDLKHVHSKLVKKWSEKGQILSQLEKQVKQMKETYEKRVQDIAKQRDQAVETKQLLTERLARADVAFREQLEAASAAHQGEMRRVTRNGENEVEMMKRKVLSVEEEMREVLRDADRQKKSMETKLRKVTSVFSELQQGFDD